MELVCIDPARVHELWPHVEPLIKRAIDRSLNTDLAALVGKLMRRAALLWVVRDGESIRAAVVTSISVVNERKRCIIVACGGDGIETWLHLIERIEYYSRDERCHS